MEHNAINAARAIKIQLIYNRLKVCSTHIVKCSLIPHGNNAHMYICMFVYRQFRVNFIIVTANYLEEMLIDCLLARLSW